MDTNPYQSPQTGYYGPADGQDSQIRVEGRALVVPTDTVLPPVCVRTNQPVSQADMVRKEFYWCPPWVAFLILLSGCLLVLVYFLVRKRFSITYGLSPDLQKSYRKWAIVKWLIVIALFLALPVTASMDVVVMVVLVLFLVAIVSLFIGNAPLSVVNHRRGLFWVKGCSKEFLARIEVEAGQSEIV